MTDTPTTGKTREAPPMAVDPKLLESLVCPISHGPLDYDRDRGELVSRHAHLAYPIRKGVPIMTPSEARKLDD